MGESTFQWGDGEITVTNTNIRTRLKENRLTRLAGLDLIQDEFTREIVVTAVFYLSHVDRVTGEVGINIPNGNANEDNVQQFIDDFCEQDETLMLRWDSAITNARQMTNDPDLVPPQDVDPNA